MFAIWSDTLENVYQSCSWPQKLNNVSSKKKAIPLQAWTGPEGSRRMRLPDLKTIGTWRW